MAGLEPRLALADCNQALTLAPGNPSYLDSRGLVDLRLGDFDGAIKDYSTALAAMPSLAMLRPYNEAARLGIAARAVL